MPMSLQFYFGASGAGKSRKLHDYIIEESQRHPEKNYLLIVPDQFTIRRRWIWWWSIRAMRS